MKRKPNFLQYLLETNLEIFNNIIYKEKSEKIV